ncbi:MAG: M13 family metallopeptidase, partial [Gammaproteobacteria bacterium]|nr:M13 family metallopeptidase [Gammaproteobacteria bacterium]
MANKIFIGLIAAGIGALAYWYMNATPVEVEAPVEDVVAEVEIEPAEPEPVSGVDLDAIKREVRPQDDFYAFANGAWLDHTEIPDIYSGYTVYHEVYEEAEKTLRDIIESAAKFPEAKGERGKIGAFYASFMDEQTINSLGIAPIQRERDLITAIRNQRMLLNAMAELGRNGVEVFFSHGVGLDDKNSSQYAFFISQDGLSLPNRDYYLETDNPRFAKAREALPAYVADMLVFTGMSETQAAQAASDIMALETKLAEAQWSSVENRDPQKRYNPYTPAELNELASNLQWELLLESLGVADIDRVIIGQPSYFEAVNALVAEVPLETWKAWLTYKTLHGWAPHLSAEVAERRFDFVGRTLRGQKEEAPRWRRGISLTNGVLGEAVGKVYVEREFPPEAKAKMEELVANVIRTFNEDIGKLEWMTPETQAKAREKLARFTPKIGYPDEWKDYSDLDIRFGDHTGNLRRAREWDYSQDLAKLGGPVDRNEWFMTPQTVNAYYSPSRNEIVFPAARLQPPFFQLNADDAINYGAVGGVIGHEISHGFDDKGSQYDGNGNLVNWWSQADREAFEARAQRLVEHYNQYEPIEGMNINGELTLGENIGDLSGVTMAYRAYIRSLNGEEPPVIDG